MTNIEAWDFSLKGTCQLPEQRFRVLHVITALEDGGAEAVLLRLCVNDGDSEHIVVSMRGEGRHGPLLRSAGIRLYCLGLPKGKLTASSLFRLWRLIRSVRPQVVQTWMYHADLIGGLTGRLAGVNAVCWGIRNCTLEPGVSSTRAVAYMCGALSRLIPTRIISCSQRASDLHQVLRYAAHKMVVIPNGYDMQRFSPSKVRGKQLRKQLGLDDAHPVLGMVARMDPQKDHDNLLNALSILKRRGCEFRFLLVGRGMDDGNELLIQMVRHYDLRDRIVLAGPQTDVPAIMNALDIHVLSSSSEAFPNVVAEAMASGTPCVATNVGDAATIVGETGWIVPAKDPKALADGMQCALSEMRELDQWLVRCEQSRRRIEQNYPLSRMVEMYRRVWWDAAA